MSTNSIPNALTRHTAAAIGAGTAAAADDSFIQILGALVTLASVAWSIWEKRQANRPKPSLYPPTTTLALLLLLTATGCQTMTTEQRLTLVQTVATESAYVGAAYALEDNPQIRPHLAASVLALEAIIAREAFSAENLRAALNGIPELRGASGALLDAGLTLYIVGTGFVTLDSAPYVRAVALGTRDGLARALARPTGPATRALNPPLPKQCAIPAR